MNDDAVTNIRRIQQAQVNAVMGGRAGLEAEHGCVWDTGEMQEDFEPLGFLAPYLACRRKSDGKKGTLTFQHSPRFYFDFVPETS